MEVVLRNVLLENTPTLTTLADPSVLPVTMPPTMENVNNVIPSVPRVLGLPKTSVPHVNSLLCYKALNVFPNATLWEVSRLKKVSASKKLPQTALEVAKLATKATNPYATHARIDSSYTTKLVFNPVPLDYSRILKLWSANKFCKDVWNKHNLEFATNVTS